MTLMLAAITASSILTWLFGMRILALNASSLRQSIGHLLEWAGLIVVFLGTNFGFAAIITIVARTFGATFMSAYPLGDFMLPVISLIQATLFQFWRTSTAASADR